MFYYHGGVAGLAVGDMILPPARTNAKCCSDYGGEGRHSRQHVYVTPSLDQAWFYAALVSRCPGYVYAVLPMGALEHDSDTQTFSEAGGVSFQCERAVIVDIVYRCRTLDTEAAWRTVWSTPMARFLASLLAR